MLWQRYFFLRLALVLFYVIAACFWIMFAFDPFPFSLERSEGRAALLMILSSFRLVAVSSGMLGVRIWAYLGTFFSGCLIFIAAYLSAGELRSVSSLLSLWFWERVYWGLLAGSGIGLFIVTLLLIKTAGKLD